MTSSEAQQAWERWCAAREAGLRGIPGNLALVANQPLGEEWEEVYEVPVARARRLADEPGVRVELDPGVTGQIDGEPFAGEGFLPRLGQGGPFLRVGSHWVDAFSLEGAAYELRIYDEQAPALTDFAGIETYPYDPGLVRRGRFVAFDEVASVPWEFTKEVDTGRPKSVPGRVVLELPGMPDGEVELVAFRDGPELVLVFADATTGEESYAPGRFLRIPAPDGDADITVDLNYSFIPPCGFSTFYSCPIPPAQNRLPVPVRAGERRARWHGERDGHRAG